MTRGELRAVKKHAAHRWPANPHFAPYQAFLGQFDEHEAVRNADEKTQRFTGEDFSLARRVIRNCFSGPRTLEYSLWLSDSWTVRVKNLEGALRKYCECGRTARAQLGLESRND